MSERFAKAALTGYRLAGSLAYPLIGSYVGWRARRGKEDGERRRERYGYASEPRPVGRSLVWVHAASIGESMAVTPLVQAIANEGIPVVMTTGTRTSAGLVQERLGEIVIHQYVPLDLKPCVSRFLDHWRPDLAIVAESEIWPMTMQELNQRRIPQILVNARLSDRSFKRWSAVPSLAEALLEHLAHVVAQSPIDAERFHLLGARAVSVAGNLKADIPPLPFDEAAYSDLVRSVGLRPVWAALSTHEGEESLAGEVHIALRERRPRLLTVIVPRHVERGDEIEKALLAQGLTVARRSCGERPDPTTDVLLGDTIGEMGLYLRLTEIAFVGKSLKGQGGQNPLEAAQIGVAVLTGRFVQNFRDVYQRLIADGGARIVKDGTELADEVDRLMTEDGIRRAMIAAGRASAEDMRGALPRTMQAIDPFLQPLRLAAGFDRARPVSLLR